MRGPLRAAGADNPAKDVPAAGDLSFAHPRTAIALFEARKFGAETVKR
jgi:hypothetical protein